MTVQEKHYVTFHSPGTFFNESSTKEIDSWNIKKAVEMSKDVTERYGAKPFAFSFSTYLEDDKGVSDGRGGSMKIEPKRIAKSANHFLGGHCMTYELAVLKNDPDEEILRSNMKNNRMWTVCVNTNSYKTVQQFDGEDVIVNSEGRVIDHAINYNEYREKMNKQQDEEDAAYMRKFKII